MIFLSVFVPIKEGPILPLTDNKGFKNILQTSESFVALVLPEEPTRKNSQKVYSAIKTMARASLEFGANANFISINIQDIPEIMNQTSLEPPYLAYFRSGILVGVSQYPENEKALAFVLRHWLKTPEGPIQTEEELYQYLGNTPIVFFCRYEHLVDGFILLEQSLHKIQPSDILVLSDSLFKKLEIDTIFAVFRLEDMTIAPVENSTESLISQSYPPCRELKASILFDYPQFALYADPNYTIDHLYAMEPLISEFPECRFVYVRDQMLNDYFYPITMPGFIILSYKDGTYYQTPLNNISCLDPSWLESARNYLNNVKTGKIEPSYRTEGEFPPEPFLHHLVGTQYADYVLRNDVDQVIYFSDDMHEFDVFETTGIEYNESGSSGIEFGFINPFLNASPVKLPFLFREPHVEFFPAGSKPASFPLPEKFSMNGLKRLINWKNTKGYHFDIPPPDANVIKSERKILINYFSRMPEQTVRKINEYYDYLANEYDIEFDDE